MKAIVTIPDEAGVTYSRLHLAIIGRVGGNGQVPMTVERFDCALSPDNYTVIATDKRSDGTCWSQFAVLSFKHKPAVPPKREENEADEDYESRCLSDREDEERAMIKACELAGVHFRAATRHAAHSPTGQPFYDGADFSLYEKTVLINQHGGIDC